MTFSNSVNDDDTEDILFWHNIISTYIIDIYHLSDEYLNKIILGAQNGDINARKAIRIACEALSYSDGINEGAYSVRINLMTKLASIFFYFDNDKAEKNTDKIIFWKNIISTYKINPDNSNDESLDKIILDAQNGDKNAKKAIKIACENFSVSNAVADENSLKGILKFQIKELFPKMNS